MAVERAPSRRYTVAEILACGCEPEIEHCDRCDGMRQFNARYEAQHAADPQRRAHTLHALLTGPPRHTVDSAPVQEALRALGAALGVEQ